MTPLSKCNTKALLIPSNPQLDLTVPVGCQQRTVFSKMESRPQVGHVVPLAPSLLPPTSVRDQIHLLVGCHSSFPRLFPALLGLFAHNLLGCRSSAQLCPYPLGGINLVFTTGGAQLQGSSAQVSTWCKNHRIILVGRDL